MADRAHRLWGVQPQHAYLFGSAARQDGDASSDVDILLVHTGGPHERSMAWAQQVDALATKTRQWTGNDSGILDISDVDLDHMQVNKEAILDSWYREGILLAGQELLRTQPKF